MMRIKILPLGLVFFVSLVGCKEQVNIDAEKLLITQKMQLKVSAIAKDLRDYCDTEMYRKARVVADSILKNRRGKKK